MKNSATETTGYEYFKKQNDRVLKKFLYDNNKKDTSSLQSINPAKYSCTTATYIKLFNIIDMIFKTNRIFQTLQKAKRK